MLVILASLSSFAQQTLWVGQSYTFDVSSSVMGITANMSWSTSGGYLSLSGSGFYRTITVTQYFSGTATVTCEWDYKLTGNGRYTHTKRQVTISCRDNQVSISPTSMTMSPGETRYVSYRHQYDNQYTSAANAYFQSTNPSVAQVNQHTGEVTALNVGETYINVYSKISSTSPYCKVNVEKIEPTSISIPNQIIVVAGDTEKISPSLTPSNATTNLTWISEDNSIAKVTQDGIISGIHHGRTTITVRTDNGLSAKCDVIVQKATLQLYSNYDDGVYEVGSQLTFTTDNPEAEIYYTKDGALPTKNSLRYKSPITLNDNIVVKAIAYHNDYNESNIKTVDITITHLTSETYPYDNCVEAFPDIIPYFEFNANIQEGGNFNDISFESSEDNVRYNLYIDGHKIYFVSEKSLSEGNYHIAIPSGAVENALTHEKNAQKELNFVVTSKNAGTSVSSSFTSYYIDSKKNLWGFGISGGAIDVNNEGPILLPKLIMGNVEQIINGGTHAAAIDSEGNLWMWGQNWNGQLGNGSTHDRNEPYKVMSDVKNVECKNGSTVYAIKNDNSLWGWGNNEDYEIDNSNKKNVLSPKKILEDIKQVSSDYYHTFAVDFNGTLWGWGYNIDGFLGTGDKKNRAYPSRITTNVAKVLANGSATYIIKNDNSLWTCGNNEFGQLGDGTTSNVTIPKKIMTDVLDIFPSSVGIFCVKTDHSLWAWGMNSYGQLGTGSFSAVVSPTQVADNVEKVTSGYSTAILKTDGSVYVCGKNENGELCNGDMVNTCNFIKMEFPTNVQDISFTMYRGMTLTDDGKVWAWGSAPRGDGTNNNILNPTIIYPTDIASIDFINFDKDQMSVLVGQECPIALNVSPMNAEFSSVWSSDNPSIASVSPRGVVKGETKGTTNVIMNAVDANGTILKHICNVLVKESDAGIDNNYSPDIKIEYKKGNLYISNINNNTSISIYDLSGRLIKEIQSHDNTISIPISVKGMYLLKLGMSKVLKFVAN